MTEGFPFAALVGQEDLKLALLVAAVEPLVGGVLIQGERGTAKTTAVRGLPPLLPPVPCVAGCALGCDPAAPFSFCPQCGGQSKSGAPEPRPARLVELPAGATEDRVLGHLDVEAALRDGRARFVPGLLARAHRGVLYVDEVNLLPDHLVDLLLDAAATGWVTVEREGLSVSHAASFLLVGTMNPEEGELRPQLLDRFGLCVAVCGPSDPAVRGEVVRRRVAYEADPAGFGRSYAAEGEALAARIAAARGRLSAVVVDDSMLAEITRVALESGAEGMRADLTIYRAARALAALDGRGAVVAADAARAAELALLHRRRTSSPPPPPPPQGPPPPPPPPDRGDGPNGDDGQSRSQTAPIARMGPVELPSPGPRAVGGPPSAIGRGGGRLQLVSRGPGPQVGARPWRGGALDVTATLRAGLMLGHVRPSVSALRERTRRLRGRRLVVFLLDASGSMGVRRRMEATKGAVLAAVARAYQRRDRVALMTFRGSGASLVLPPTNSVALARSVLAGLPTGGRTPLAAGLTAARDLVVAWRRRHPGSQVLLVACSDGRANAGGGDPLAEAMAVAAGMAQARIEAVVVDTEEAGFRLGLAGRLAETLGAECLSLDELRTRGGRLARHWVDGGVARGRAV